MVDPVITVFVGRSELPVVDHVLLLDIIENEIHQMDLLGILVVDVCLPANLKNVIILKISIMECYFGS